MAKQIIPPNAIEKFLNTKIFSNGLIEIDYWSFIHFGVGIFLFYLLHKLLNLSETKTFLLFVGLLIVYELIEFSLWGTMFRKESLINIIWDLLFAIIGYGIIYLLK